MVMEYCPADKVSGIFAHNFLKSGRLAILIQFMNLGSVTSSHCRLLLLILYFFRSLGQAMPSVVMLEMLTPLGFVMEKVSLKMEQAMIPQGFAGLAGSRKVPSMETFLQRSALVTTGLQVVESQILKTVHQKHSTRFLLAALHSMSWYKACDFGNSYQARSKEIQAIALCWELKKLGCSWCQLCTRHRILPQLPRFDWKELPQESQSPGI